jgi:hypothetical protein
MSDITKCINAVEINCPLRFKCYRFLAPSEKGDKNMAFDYWANSCNGFWEVKTAQEEREEQYKQQQEEFKPFG